MYVYLYYLEHALGASPGFISHGFLPESMLSVVLVPVIKDKAGKIYSKDNYRPIALASVISKLVEVIMLDKIEMYMNTNS